MNTMPTMEESLVYKDLVAKVAVEAARATKLHGEMNGPHEGYAIILEELDELWEHVRANTTNTPECKEECIQIAAMAVKFAHNLIN